MCRPPAPGKRRLARSPASMLRGYNRARMAKRLFRTMKVAEDGRPAVGRSAKMLGVRVDGPHADVDPDSAGRVHPGKGMSVTADDPWSLDLHLLPPEYGGHSKEPLWVILDDRIRAPLAMRPAGRRHHMHVEPRHAMQLVDYERALVDTRPHWSRA